MVTAPPRKRLGLIGFGSFGQLAARYLREHFEVIAADADDRSHDAADLGVEWGSVAEAAACPTVVLAVPVQSFVEALDSIHDHLRAGALVVDVASVKSMPVAEMERLLPPEVEILGTHPMFGPQSAADGLGGHRIVLCPVRTSRLDKVREFLEGSLALDVYVCDAETHDREIAETQALAQFVGRALAQLERSESPVRTPGYNLFREVAETVGDDSWQLFTAIQNLNPYAADMRAELLGHLDALQRSLAQESGEASEALDSSDSEPAAPAAPTASGDS